MIKYFHFRENGEIMTWGDEPLPGALAVDTPSDFIEKGMHRFILVDGVLIEREAPVAEDDAEPTVPAPE